MNDYEDKESNSNRTVRAAGDSYAYGLRQRRTDERTKEDKSGAQ